MADWYLHNLYQIDASSGSVAQLLEFGVAMSPTAVASDSRNQCIYWADYAFHTVNRYSLITNTTTSIYRDSAYNGRLRFFGIQYELILNKYEVEMDRLIA